MRAQFLFLSFVVGVIAFVTVSGIVAARAQGATIGMTGGNYTVINGAVGVNTTTTVLHSGDWTASGTLNPSPIWSFTSAHFTVYLPLIQR
jgi:hypothetical protein